MPGCTCYAGAKVKGRKEHIFYRYVIKINGKVNKFFRLLFKEGIEAKSPVYKPLHKYLGLDNHIFPNTNEAMRSALSLPIYPTLSNKEAEAVIEGVNRTVSSK